MNPGSTNHEIHPMKTTSLTRFSLLSVLLTSACFAAPVVLAETHDHAAMMKMDAPADQAAWLAQAKAAYPLTTCVVSGDKLEGEMGGPIDYVHKEAGKPDRLVEFCCKDCIKDFKKDPAQYLKKIDDAAMAKMGHAASKP
jgi:hypothetical protein